MIYSALCLENTNYFTTGTILVRIFQYYIHPSKTPEGDLIEYYDLHKDPSLRTSGEEKDSETGEIIQKDFEAYVFAPLGGGKNYGMFSLPKINERGVVSFLDGDFNKPLWLGSYFTPTYDKDRKFEGVNIPIDKVDGDEILNGADKDGSKMTGDERTIVLRTKHTVSDDADTMDWEQRNTENLIVLGDSLVRVRHHTGWEDDHTTNKYQEVLIYKDDDKETMQLDVNNISESGKQKRGLLKLTEDGLTITLYDQENGTTNTFELTATGDGINFTDQYGNQIIGTDQGLTINALDGDVNDHFIRYSDLKSAMDLVKKHVHAAAIIVGEPLVSNSNRGPLTSKIDQLLTDMKIQKIQTYDSD